MLDARDPRKEQTCLPGAQSGERGEASREECEVMVLGWGWGTGALRGRTTKIQQEDL